MELFVLNFQMRVKLRPEDAACVTHIVDSPQSSPEVRFVGDYIEFKRDRCIYPRIISVSWDNEMLEEA